MEKTNSLATLTGPSAPPTGPPAYGAPKFAAQIGRMRWTICALLFFGTTMNYVDRQVLALLAPVLQKSIGWNEIQYGYIVTAFQGAYALGLLLMGRLMDRIGARAGYALSILLWSVSAMAHALARTPLAFGVVRFALGFSEAGNFPVAIKTVAEWFPKKERALATGIFNSGTNIGAAVAPLFVLWIANRAGWQFAFLSTGLLSALPIFFWIRMYRKPEAHPRLSQEELRYIKSDLPETIERIPWARLLPHPQTWAVLIAKFMTDPIWWFFLFWLPKFLDEKHGLSLTQLGPPLVVIYNAACVGSIFGGWLPARLLKAGWSANRARKIAMLVCALAVVPIIAVANVKGLWTVVALISLATAAHQGWSANLFTLASDMFPKSATASVVGIAGFGGAVGGMLIATFTGWVLQVSHSYLPMFVTAGSAYLLALAIVHFLAPNLAPASLDTAATTR